MKIERERPEDQEAVAVVIARAFGRADEALLVEALRGAGDISLSLVARESIGITGHIAFQPVRVEGSAAPVAAFSLAPVSVVPERQGRGIGSALIRNALDQLRDNGADIVFVLGDPAYYERFGFSVRAAEAFTSPWPGPHFMALDMTGRATGGRLTYPRAFFEGAV